MTSDPLQHAVTDWAIVEAAQAIDLPTILLLDFADYARQALVPLLPSLGVVWIWLRAAGA